VPAIVGSLQTRHPGQIIIAAKAKATETTTCSFCQKTVVHGKSVQAQVFGGLFHVLVAGRQWTGLSGRKQ